MLLNQIGITLILKTQMEFYNSLNNQAEILVIHFTIHFISPRCLCVPRTQAPDLPRKQSWAV